MISRIGPWHRGHATPLCLLKRSDTNHPSRRRTLLLDNAPGASTVSLYGRQLSAYCTPIMPIRPYLDSHRLDPETVRLLGIAFETALQALRSWGVFDPPREAVAKALIDLAKGGERDPERLCDEALKACQGAIISVPTPLPPPDAPPRTPDSSS